MIGIDATRSIFPKIDMQIRFELYFENTIAIRATYRYAIAIRATYRYAIAIRATYRYSNSNSNRFNAAVGQTY